jgi:bacterioferritin
MKPTQRQAPLHPQTLGYLGRALSLELSAVQQYLTQATLVESWGLTEAAERFRTETVEEMRHAERIVRHMLGLGVAPNASHLRPAAVAHSLGDLLLQDARLESEIVGLYAQALAFSQRIGDEGSAALFQGLLADEVHHAREIDDWLEQLAGSGEPRWVADEARATF